MQVLHKISHLMLLIVMSCCLVSSAWAGFNIWNDEYTISKSELQQTLSAKFPKVIGDKSMIQMQLTQPVLNLDADKNRFVITFTTTIDGPLLGKAIHGTITVSSGIQYDEKRLSVSLEDPTIDHTEFNDVDSKTNQQIALFSNLLMQQMLHHYAVYTFKPEQFTFNGQYYQPKSVAIQTNQIVVQMEKATAP